MIRNSQIPISDEEIEAVGKDAKGTNLEDRLKVIARSRKISELAKELLSAKAALSKSNFTVAAATFLSTSIYGWAKKEY